METAQYLDIFIIEAQDHLQEMNQALLALEENPAGLNHLEAFFRAAHTLKGMAAAMGFQRMAALSHDMEDVLHALRQREHQLTPELADVLFRCLDALSDLLQTIAAEEEERGDVAPVQQMLRTAKEVSPSATTGAVAPAAPSHAVPPGGWEVHVEVARDCVLKGARAFLIQKRLAAIAPIVDSEPPAEALRAGKYEESFRLFFAAGADPTVLQRQATSVAEVSAVAVRPTGEPETRSVPPRESRRPAAAGGEVPAAPAGAPAEAAAAGAAFVRVRVALLERLLETAADLMINRSHLNQVARRHDLIDLKEVLEVHASAVDRLQGIVLAMRMTPVGQVFNRFPRMVRDLAHQQEKSMRFEMEGAELELDRTVLDKITDPLVHLLRNAIDHGVELPEEREAAGKPVPAHVQLRAYRLQDKAVIEIQDDGRGLSPQKILDVAVERGLITAQEAAEMDTAAIFELICRPGFSTQKQVTGVSGRGVGMEVVKQTMDEIGGMLEIESRPGQGTCFRLILPLTMAILPALLVRVAEEIYALPLTHVVRTVEPLQGEVRLLHQQPVLQWEEQILPLVTLAELLEVGTGKLDEATGENILPVVVVARGRQRYGMVVDEILGKEDIVLKPVGEMLQQVEGVAGATIRDEGRIVLVLDIAGLVRPLEQSEVGKRVRRATRADTPTDDRQER